MSVASMDGIPISEAVLTVPLVGCWTVDLRLTSDSKKVQDGDRVSLTFMDLALSGTVFRGGNFTGSGSLRIVGGRGRWRKRIPPRYYHTPFGVKSADVVGDAARECGEEMVSPAPGTAGIRWVRREGPAGAVLQRLCPSWWMGFDGRTNPAARPSGAISSKLNVLSDAVTLSDGRISCSPDSLVDVLPGNLVSSPTVSGLTATEVVHSLDAGRDRVRSEIWCR